MLTLKQADPHWSTATIGKTKYTLARWGCTITSLSMASDYFKEYTSPDRIAANNWYDSEARILWNKISFKKFKFLRRGYGEDQKIIKWALKEPSTVVLIQVSNSHWLCATADRLIDYVCADPISGTRVWVKKRYGKKSITGFALFQTI